MTLFVPPSVPVPPGMELPPWFQAEQRPAAPPVAPPVSPPADEGYTPPPATFLLNESGTAGSRTLSFGGSATGDITLRINEAQTHLIFCKRYIYPIIPRQPDSWLNPGHGHSTATRSQFHRPFLPAAGVPARSAATRRVRDHWPLPSAATSTTPHWHAPRRGCH